MTAAVPVRVVIRGARGTVASPGPGTVRIGGHTSCVEVRLPAGELLVLDAGTGLRTVTRLVAEAAVRGEVPLPGHLDLLLTHRHLDHVTGLPFLVTYTALGGRVTVRCGNGGVPEVERLLDQFLGPPLFPAPPETRAAITCEPFGTGGRMTVGGHTVQAIPAHHPGEAAILVLSNANGPLFAYAPDNELACFDPSPARAAWRDALAERLRGVPVLLHDAHWATDEAPRFGGWGHSAATEATRLAIACGARRLLLGHHHPDRDDAGVEALVAECRRLAEREGSPLVIDAAWEGLTILPEGT